MTPSKPGSPQRVPVFFIIACAFLANAGARMKIDEYDPPEPNSNGTAVILLYGSGGLKSSAFNYSDEARQIARMGYPVYLPHYLDATHGSANAPESHYETWANTQQYTLSRILERQQYTLSPKGFEGVPQSRIAIVGYSLGGSVALAFASKEPHLAGVVVWSGSMPDAYRDVETLPPLLILHGAHDHPAQQRPPTSRALRDEALSLRPQHLPRRGACVLPGRDNSRKPPDPGIPADRPPASLAASLRLPTHQRMRIETNAVLPENPDARDVLPVILRFARRHWTHGPRSNLRIAVERCRNCGASRKRDRNRSSVKLHGVEFQHHAHRYARIIPLLQFHNAAMQQSPFRHDDLPMLPYGIHYPRFEEVSRGSRP